MGSLKGDARINQRIREVGDQHAQQGEGRADEKDGHYGVVVANIDALEQIRPHAGNAEHHLDDHRTADECRKQGCEQGQDGDHAVSCGVLEDDDTLWQALGARGQYELFIDFLIQQ